MKFEHIQDKNSIERVLRRNLYLNIYGIGDLDDFFWPFTTWYGFSSTHQLESVILLYKGMPPPTLVALSDDSATISQLLTAAIELLPEKFYAHLSPGLASNLEKNFNLESHGLHYKMALLDKEKSFKTECSEVVQLGIEFENEIQKLFEVSYPGNWFDPRMLETNKYYGIIKDNLLICLAGIHVYSLTYRVAALGNITTRPVYRNKGYGAKAAAKLCQVLLEENLDIGLNVKADNLSAIACYRKIGFEIVTPYEEFLIYKN